MNIATRSVLFARNSDARLHRCLFLGYIDGMAKKKKKKKRSLSYTQIHLAYRDPADGGLGRLARLLESGEVTRAAIKRLAEHLKQHGGEPQLLAWCEQQQEGTSGRGRPPPAIGETRPYETTQHRARKPPVLRLPLHHILEGTKKASVAVSFFKDKIVVRPG